MSVDTISLFFSVIAAIVFTYYILKMAKKGEEEYEKELDEFDFKRRNLKNANDDVSE